HESSYKGDSPTFAKDFETAFKSEKLPPKEAVRFVSNQEVLDDVLRGQGTPVKGTGGVTLDAAYVNAKLDDWFDFIRKTYAKVSDVALNDPNATAASFPDRTSMERAY